jgi:cytosine/adenosine deaminase-related metal-dependent hydrolase
MRDAKSLTATQLIDTYRRYIVRWHGAQDGRLRAAVSCSAPQRVERDYLHALSRMAAEFDLPYNMHILETRLQRVLGLERFGCSLVQYVHDEGVLDERAHVIHAIWVDEHDMDLLAASGCSIAHNPLCNLKLGSGIMPFRALKSRGINICLGSDEMCSDDSVNMWNVMKSGGLVHKITEPDYRRWPTAQEMLEGATRNAGKAMRLANLTGQIAVGMQADLILLDLDTFALTPLNDLRRQLVFCENGSSVRMVMVAGNVVVEDGRLLTLDEAALRSEIREQWAEYQQQFCAVEHWARALEPIYRRMYERTTRVEVGMTRKLTYAEFPFES